MKTQRPSPLLESLKTAIPGLALSALQRDRISYSRDLWPRRHIDVRAGHVRGEGPQLVAWPTCTEQTAAIVAWCAERGVAIVPFGAGSGVCAGIAPKQDSLVVDFKRMRQWREFDEQRGTLDVESGAIGIRLEEELQARGQTAGHFPSSILCSTVGGWVAGRGAGQCSGRYGKIEDMVAAVELVNGRGEVCTHHRRNNGPSLVPLVVGSEGTLGLITSVKLRLHPVAEHRHFNSMTFPTMAAGYHFIQRIYQAGLRPAVCRLYDPFDSFMARRGKKGLPMPRAGKTGLFQEVAPAIAAYQERTKKRAGQAALRSLLRAPAPLNAAIESLGERFLGACKLVLIFEGDVSTCEAQASRAEHLAKQAGATLVGPGPALHWLEHRYSVSYRQAPMFMAGTFVDTMEVAAPWSRLQALYGGVRQALAPHVFVMAHISHAYPDGCSIYFTFAGCDKDDAGSKARYDKAWKSAMQAAIEAGGTLAHHHGVGRSKATMMRAELGEGIDVLRRLRQTVDPAGIFNPGNLMPDESDPPSVTGIGHRATPPATPRPDRDNGLIHAAGEHRLVACKQIAEAAGLQLSASHNEDTTVATWIADGAPGAADPWLDPVGQTVSGFSARLHNGTTLQIRACPRRSVGPDLFSLFFGMDERIGTIQSVHLQARHVAAPPLATELERNPALSTAEAAQIEEICQGLSGQPLASSSS